jgi:hypothetical protein
VLAIFLTVAIAPVDAAVLKGPYLIYEGTNTEMTVLWQLDSTQPCTIKWGETELYGQSSNTVEYGDDHQHRYTIPGLTPGTKYYYRVEDSGSVEIGNGSFMAAPPSDATHIKLMAYGDTRSNPDRHDNVNAQMINTYTADPGFQTLSLHVGDWVYDGNDETHWAEQFFDPSWTYTHEFQANVALNGCVGNHEFTVGETLFDKYFPYPYATGSNFYWSFDYGPAHIVVIDQYTDSYATGSAQHDWLVNDLASTNKEWKFIVLHEPGWTAGNNDNEADVQDYVHPLCLTWGVDIVFAGHKHLYARCDVDGVQHITTGGGGVSLHTAHMDAPYLVTAEAVRHFCEIDIQGKQLFFTARREDGTVIESFDISHADFQVTPNQGVTFSGLVGGPFSPADESYTLSNDGGSLLAWSAMTTDSWVGLSSDNGTLAAGASEDVILTPDAGNLAAGTYADTIVFADTTNGTTTNRDVNLEVIAPDNFAIADMPGEGTINGSYSDTHVSDNSYEEITEAQSGGGQPKNLRSSLEHTWEFDVGGGGNMVTFYVEAHHTANSEGDDFVFAYSTDNSTYTEMFTVTNTVAGEPYLTYALPSSTVGPVYVRVQDADQTRGNGTPDTLFVNHMYIYKSTVSTAPDPATHPDPSDGAAGVASDVDLSWTAGAYAESHDVYFGTASPPPFSVNQSGTTFDPGTLDNGTTYYWRIDEKNGYGTTTGPVWSFTTNAGGNVDVHVHDIAMNYGQAGKNYYGIATVSIKDGNGVDVEGATVHGEWSGAVSNTVSGVTGPNGTVTLQSPRKKNGGTFTFTVTDVVQSGYIYLPSADVETTDSITAPPP